MPVMVCMSFAFIWVQSTGLSGTIIEIDCTREKRNEAGLVVGQLYLQFAEDRNLFCVTISGGREKICLNSVRTSNSKLCVLHHPYLCR